MEYATPLIFLASIGVTSKFGNCSALCYLSGRAIQVLECQDYGLAKIPETGIWWQREFTVISSLAPTPMWKLHVTSREWGVTRNTKELDHERLLVTVILGSLFSPGASLAIWIWKFWCGTKATQVYTDLHIFDSLTMVEPMECSAEQRLSLAGVQERRPLIEQIVLALNCLLLTNRYCCSRNCCPLPWANSVHSYILVVSPLQFYGLTLVPHLPFGDQTPAHSESRRSL
jgi:hypothetical protein